MGVTIKSDGTDGKHYEITLDKTGHDTGKVDVKTWNGGANQAAKPADGDDSYNLKDIRAKSDGSAIVCTAVVPFINPTVTIAVTPPKQNHSASITVTIGSLIHKTSVYAVSQTDFTDVESFVTNSGFPALA